MSYRYNADGSFVPIETVSEQSPHQNKIINQLLGYENFEIPSYNNSFEKFEMVNTNIKLEDSDELPDWLSMTKMAKEAQEVNPPILTSNDTILSESETSVSGYDSKIYQFYAPANPRVSSSNPLNTVPDRMSPLSPASVNGAVMSNCCNGTTFAKCLQYHPEETCMQNCKNICPLKF